MGVAGLWEVLRPAGHVRSLTDLAVEDGFNARPQRGFRIGIDASIWFFHAAYGKEGENPELRTLFFRCCRLLQSPLLPLFVFDGPHRPAVKRGKRVGGNAHWLTQGMKNIIEAFGFEWRVAPGEAEAELAYLNRVGVVDAVLSDDVDNFLFGATMVIRNPSNTLSGNRAHPVKNSQGKDDGNHVVAYTSKAILDDPSVALSRAGTILIGLLSGGDYIPAGLPGCGQKFATGLARAGFGDSLMTAVKDLKGAQLDAFLDQWRQDVRHELKTNKSGLLPSKKPSLAAALPDDFPSLPVLLSYADPITSENTLQKGNDKSPPGVWRNDPDPMRIASLCELYFEWGVKDVIVQRFRTVLWPGIVCRAVRRTVLNEEARRRPTRARHLDSDDENADTTGPSSPTKQISSTLAALALSSPSKKSSTSSASESFTLCSLVSLIPPASPGSSRSTHPSPSPLLLEILSERTHASTDSMLEYRVLIDPTTLVERAESGVKGLRPPLVGGLFGIDPEDEDDDQDADESASDNDERGFERLETAGNAAARSGTKRRKARREVPTTPLRLWLPACMIRAAAPALVEGYEEKVRMREEKKAKRGTRRGRGGRARAAPGSTKGREVAGDDGTSVPGPSTSKTTVGSKSKTKAVGGRRRKPKQASEAQDDAYEFIDLSAGESPCLVDGEDVEQYSRGKGKSKAKVTEAPKRITKGNAKTANTVDEFFNTTKSITSVATKSKPSKLKGSSAAPKRIYEEEEEDSVDLVAPPPLPKTLRPLDILRAKSKLNAHPKPSSRPKSPTPRYEDEESSPSSPPRASQPAAQPRKKPLFVDVSDTDSEIEVSDVRRPSTDATAPLSAHDGTGDVNLSVGVDNALSTSRSRRVPRRVVDGVIDLIGRNGTRSKSAPSTSMLTTSLPPERPPSAPVGTATINPRSTTRSPSKLSHIILPPLGSESEEQEEGTEGDRLPLFHRGSANTKTKDTAVRPDLRPFPMQWSPVSPHASRIRAEGKSRQGDEHDDDTVEIVDVFTTPRGPSPPRSPIPSPSPVKSRPASSEQPSGFLVSPTTAKFRTSAGREKTKQRRRVSSDTDTHVSESERDGIHKSPRKSVAHLSPRRIPDARERAASPTPPTAPTLSRSASTANNALRTDGEASDGGQPRPEGSRSTDVPGDGVGRKPRSSDASAIYISSGSEDERDAGLILDDNGGGGGAGGDGDREAWTDDDMDGWADHGMILSVPPSPACAVPLDTSPVVPDVDVDVEAAHPRPGRTSKFKPAIPVRLNADVRVELAKTRSRRADSVGDSDEGIVVRPTRRAPLLVARAKSSRAKDEDVIDLTCD